jgi:hypothetical protein
VGRWSKEVLLQRNLQAKVYGMKKKLERIRFSMLYGKKKLWTIETEIENIVMYSDIDEGVMHINLRKISEV